ncbi:MAG: hypothetical protein ACYCYO_12490 [Bacilli bacterium]
MNRIVKRRKTPDREWRVVERFEGEYTLAEILKIWLATLFRGGAK